MLGATGSKSAVVLSVSQAKRITEMLEVRTTPSREQGMLGVDVGEWPTVRIVPDTPAARAGLRDGDVVLRVNGRDIAKTERAADGLKALGGTADATIHMTIRRGNEILAFEVHGASAAARVSMRAVGSGVVLIRIPSFEDSGIADRVKSLISTVVPTAASSVILDLRNNPGGRAEEANGVANVFLDEKILQIFEFRDGRRIGFKTTPGAIGVRVLVLTNRDTASAAEMLAIALHDNHRATVIGQPTAGYLFGKDFEKLTDGRIVVFRSEPTVLSPTGKDYSETGLTPDIEVAESKGGDDDKVLTRAIQVVRTAERENPH
jgi:carboxyl-terminal processing protease